MQAFADRLSRSLESTGLVTVTQTDANDNQIGVMLRLSPGKEGKWLELVDKLHDAMEENRKQAHAWEIDTSKKYFKKKMKDGRRLVWGWVITVRSLQMSTSLDFLTAIIRGKETPSNAALPGEITSMPFTGMEDLSDRNTPSASSRKGAYHVEGQKHENFRISR